MRCLFESMQSLKCLKNWHSLHRIITSENIFKEIGETLIHYKPKWNLLRCGIDSGKNMCEAEKLDKFTKIAKIQNI